MRSQHTELRDHSTFVQLLHGSGNRPQTYPLRRGIRADGIAGKQSPREENDALIHKRSKFQFRTTTLGALVTSEAPVGSSIPLQTRIGFRWPEWRPSPNTGKRLRPPAVPPARTATAEPSQRRPLEGRRRRHLGRSSARTRMCIKATSAPLRYRAPRSSPTATSPIPPTQNDPRPS